MSRQATIVVIEGEDLDNNVTVWVTRTNIPDCLNGEGRLYALMKCV